MNKMVFATIMTQLRRKKDKGLLRSYDTHMSCDKIDGENIIIHNPVYNDFYFIVDKNTLPPGLNQSYVHNGVELKISDKIVMIRRLPVSLPETQFDFVAAHKHSHKIHYPNYKES